MKPYSRYLSAKLISYLQRCIERGSVRPDVDPPFAVDYLTGMLLSGMIRRHVSPVKRRYSRKQYIEGSTAEVPKCPQPKFYCLKKKPIAVPIRNAVAYFR